VSDRGSRTQLASKARWPRTVHGQLLRVKNSIWSHLASGSHSLFEWLHVSQKWELSWPLLGTLRQSQCPSLPDGPQEP
jgi:hypothetical protein